jgi:riboflavin biosynthesis pyrimidine reductase
VIVSRSLELDPGARCFSGPVVVVTCEAADPTRRRRLAAVADVVVAGAEQVDFVAAVGQLHDRGLTRLLCEGGPQLLTGLLSADLVDELCLTLTPLLLGAGPQLLSRPLPYPHRLGLTQLIDGDDGVLLARYSTRLDR